MNDGSGNGFMMINGIDFYGNGSVSYGNGASTIVTTGGNPTGLQVNYAISDPSGVITSLTGLFTFPAPNCVQVHYTIGGAPSTVNFTGNNMFRWALPSATYTPVKLGVWTPDPNGGLPYEVLDSVGSSVIYSSGAIGLLKTPNANLSWSGYTWETNLPPTYNSSSGTWTADAYFYLPSTTARPVIESAAAAGKLVATDVWTNQTYNIWSTSGSPFTAYAQASNPTGTSKNITLTWSAHNYAGTVVASGTETRNMGPGQFWTDTLSIPAPSQQGIIFLEVDATDGTNTALSKTNLAYLPPHTFSSGTNSIFGLSANFQLPTAADELNLLQRMGVRWLRGQGYTTAQAQSIGLNMGYTGAPTSMAANGGNSNFSAAWVDSQLSAASSDNATSWEFCNEENALGGDEAGAASNYAAWLTLLHQEKINQNSSVQIRLGGLAGMDDTFVDDLYSDGGWPNFDVFAVHPGRGNFTADSPGENDEAPDNTYWDFFGTVRNANAKLKQYGTKPLYLTETYADTRVNDYWRDSYRQAAENVVLQYALAMEENVKVMYFYQLNDTVWYDMGGIDPNNDEYEYGLLNRDLSPKPSLMGYCTVAQALDQATFSHWMSFEDPNTHGLMYNTPSGPVAILWNRHDGYMENNGATPYASPQPWVDEWPTKTTVTLPASGSSVTVVDAIGESTTVAASSSNATITLDGAPRIVYGLAATAGQNAILDNSDTVGITTTGTWTNTTTLSGYYGTNCSVSTSSSGYAQKIYTPHIGQNGSYQVSIWFPGSASNSSKVPVIIRYAGGSAVIDVNETTGGQWISLGTYDFAQGMSGSVTISNSGTTGNVIADAVSFSEIESSANQISWNLNDIGVNPTANDSSGNGYTGTSVGNIICNGATYSGFSSTSNYVAHTFAVPFPSNLTSDSGDMWDQNFTFIANISNPGSGSTNLIARGGSNSGGDNAWQLSMSAPVSGQSTFTLVIGTWYGQAVVATSSSVAITAGTTYQVALVWNYTNANPTYTFGYNLYVTPVSGTSAPALGTTAVNVLSGSQSLNAGPSAGNAGSLFVGGAGNGYVSQFAGGSFGGSISNARLITGTALTVSQVEAFQVAPNSPAGQISWKFNESGTNPVAADTSGSGFPGTSAGGVTGNGTYYSGFTSTSTYVSHAFATPFPGSLTGDSGDMWDQNFTFLSDICNPGTNTTNLIARGGSYSNGDNAWQLSMSAPVSGQSTFTLVIGTWNSQCVVVTSNPVTITAGTTYQVALVWTYTNANPTFTIGYTLYVSPSTSTSATSVMSGSQALNAGPNGPNAGSLFVGGAGAGYYSQFPGGYFGGSISNVRLITGTALNANQIRALP